MRYKKYTAYYFILLSLALLCILIFAYAFTPDSMMAITFFPAWLWILPGLILLVPALIYKWRPVLTVTCCWVLFFAIFVEEFHCIARGIFTRTAELEKLHHEGKTLRIISLNCAGANAKVAREAIAYKPDILMLTESPSRSDVNEIARELFGASASVAWDHEATIIAPGTVIAKAIDKKSKAFMTAAHVKLKSGFETQTINARLLPTYVGMNIFSPYEWKQHKDNRRDHRKQIAKITAQLEEIPQTMPVIVGGDLNVVAGDGSLTPLKPRLRDAVRSAGIGWPNSAPNEIPLVRIDQLWLSSHFKILAIRTVKTRYSDHRMLICDVQLKPSRK